MFRQNSSVKTKIIMMFSLVIIISIVVIAWLMGGIMHDKVIKAAQEKLESDLAMTKLVLDYKYPGDWQIINDKIYKGEVPLNNNYDLVDVIGELTGDTVTVFQGDTRVTTNVITDTGERATDTQVSDNVAQVTLIEKSQYVGEAEVVGVINQTVYEPIKDKDGTVIGILYVGVPNTPYDKMASEFKTKTYLFGLVFIVAACLIGWYFSRRLCRNIINIKKVADRVAQGDLNVNIDINSHDEIGALAWSLNNMTNNLNEVMTNINSAAEQVSAGSRQVSDSSLTLSQGATEQASSIEELTSSIEQIFAQTKQNANNATEASELAEKTKLNAEKGNQQMADMLRSMEEINNASSNISKIIKVIDDIAFQTNILSLNAAVEAAHAGQHGKGFAVVAEEVRNLAARSADAAKETTNMIESSIKKVEVGSTLANVTAVALSRMVEDVAEAAKLVNDIAIASNEQTMGINQINQGIMQVSEVVQNNTATAEEGASSSEELFSQADILKQQVNRFKLKKNFK